MQKNSYFNTLNFQEMKKSLSILFFLAFNVCYAATGNANDGILFMLAVIVIMLLLLAIGYLIDFLKSRIKETRTRRTLNRNVKDDEGDLINPYDEVVPGLDGLSGI
jgi:hypothetical protein